MLFPCSMFPHSFTISPPFRAVAACTDQTYFALYRNSEQTGGTAQTGLITAETCTAACTQAAPECFGVDFNTADNTCHHHTTSRLTTGPTAVAAGNVDHYRRVCGGKRGSEGR